MEGMIKLSHAGIQPAALKILNGPLAHPTRFDRPDPNGLIRTFDWVAWKEIDDGACFDHRVAQVRCTMHPRLFPYRAAGLHLELLQRCR